MRWDSRTLATKDERHRLVTKCGLPRFKTSRAYEFSRDGDSLARCTDAVKPCPGSGTVPSASVSMAVVRSKGPIDPTVFL
jgi:hypothetical protein